jgi:hypothetical protein
MIWVLSNWEVFGLAEGVKRRNQLAAETASSLLDSPAVSSGFHSMQPLVDRVCLRRGFHRSLRVNFPPVPHGVSTQYCSTFLRQICNLDAAGARGLRRRK